MLPLPRPLSLYAAAVALMAAAGAHADSLTVVPPVQAVRLRGAVTVDGALDEAVWRDAPPVTQFTQRDPDEGKPPTQRTEVRVAYDDEALYIGARMWDAHPDSVVARLVRRDNSCQADRFMVYVDPFHDRRSGMYFGVNAAGVLYDGTLFNDSWDDNAWDGVWEARARVDDKGWTAEMRIPFSQLRFRPGAQPVWGINFRRSITRTNETDWLVYLPRSGSGFVSRFPDLVGLSDLRSGRSIELLPYVTAKAEYLDHQANDPFNDGSRYRPGAGGDLRTRVGPALTLNATANPDFGQVEVDPAVVNLSDVESYFQEKRPFFVENARAFSFGNEGASDFWGFNWPEPTFFYSRRIGRAPEGAVNDSAQYVDAPVATHILGAAKLTGKLGAFNVGTVHALTAREQADRATPFARWRSDVEPLTYYEDTRVFREFPGGRNGVGAMGSAVARQFDDGVLRDQLNRASLTGGVDGFHFLDRSKAWVVTGYVAGTQVTGSRERLLALQTGSTHYLQRPDREHVHVDSSATSMTGWMARLWLNKQSGKHFFSNSALGAISPQFEVNDIGFQSRADVINAHLGAGWKWDNLTPWRKYANVMGALFQSRDFDDNIIWQGVWLHNQLEFINNYSWSQSFAFNPQTVNNRRTRGGPLTLNRPGAEWYEHFDTDSKQKVFFSSDMDAYFQPAANAFNWSLSTEVDWQPRSNLLLSVGPSFSRDVESAQYVDQFDDAGATATFGRRYVFAHLDQRTVAADIRLNVSFTPALSLQTFLQPLISAADYTDYESLDRPRSFDFSPYAYTGDPRTFNVRALRGNAVLRWEYAPGSTMYLVWTQQRNDFEPLGDLEFGHSLSRLVSAKANDIFLAKVTYYFAL